MPALTRTPIATLAALAVTFASCQATPRTVGEDRPDGVRPDGTQPLAASAADRFRAWAHALPEESVMPPMSGTMEFSMAGDLACFTGGDPDALDLPLGATSDFAMDFQGRLELESWSRLRAEIDLRLEFGPLRAQNPEPLLVGLLLVADGESIWLEPDWSQAWFLGQLQGQATGFERLVFTIGVSTVKEFMEAVADTMEGEAAEWYRGSIACASNPARLTRLLADQATIESFSTRGQRVVADLALDLSEWMPQDVPTPGFAGPLRYRCEFDVATGAVLHTSYTMGGEGEGFTMTFLQEMELAEAPFAEGSFAYELPKGRQAFPMDLFMRPALAALRMESGKRPPSTTDDDLPF